MSKIPSMKSQQRRERGGLNVPLDIRPRPPHLTPSVFAQLKPTHREEARKRISVYSAADGWMNELTSLGVRGKDPSTSTRYASQKAVSHAELEQLYRHEGIGRKIVDYPVREMFRRGFYVQGDTEGLAVDNLEKIGALSHLKQGFSWARLFGGAVGVMLVDDGQYDLSKPLDLKNVRSFSGINNFDRYSVSWYTDTLDTDPTSPYFMQPELYHIFPLWGNPFWVHRSRVIRYPAQPLTARMQQLNMGWDDSVLQSVWNKIESLGESMGYTKSILRTFIVQTLSMKGISQLIAAGNKGIVEKRMEVLRAWISTLNMVPLDAQETYNKSASSVSGLADLLDMINQWVVSDTPIPYSILFSKGASRGLSKGGGDAEVQLEIYREYCCELQDQNLRPILTQQVLPIIFAASEGPFKGVEPEKWAVVFNPLAQPTAKEEAETRKTDAEADEIRIRSGVLMPEWVTESRYGGQRYGSDISIPDNWAAELETKAEEDAAAEAEAQALAAASAAGAPGKKKAKGGQR